MMRLTPLFLLVACAAPDADAFRVPMSLAGADEVGTSDQFVDVVDAAEETLHVALPTAEDTVLTDAIIAAWDRGVDVAVVSDVDQANDAGIVALIDAGVPVQLGDGAVGYFDFAFNLDVEWASEDVLMSHGFAVADGRWWVGSTLAGSLQPGLRVVVGGENEELAEDLISEHLQIFGGSDATALTAYSGMAKSIADFRWRYGTDTDVTLDLWLGPQERTVKRVIDGVYSARHSVRVLTNDLANDGLVKALQDKAAWGFDVQVVVGPEFGESASVLSRVLTNDAPDVVKAQVHAGVEVPTIVLIDLEGGKDTEIRGFVVSHDLYSSSRLYKGSEVRNDQLIDGSLWVITDFDDASDEIETLAEIWQAHVDVAEAF